MGDDPSPAPLFSTKLGLGMQEEEARGKQILQVGQCLGSGQGPALHTWLRCDPPPGREWDIPIPMDQGWKQHLDYGYGNTGSDWDHTEGYWE